MTAYCLFDNIEVTHPDHLAQYVEQVGDIVHRYNGRYLSVGGRVDTMEGDQTLHYPVLLEFPDLESAHRWYSAPEYQQLKALRLGAVKGTATFFESGPSPLLTGDL